MSRFSPPERHTRDIRPAAEPKQRPEREQPKFRRIAILAAVPGLSRPEPQPQR
jgi:hypothetical protein